MEIPSLLPSANADNLAAAEAAIRKYCGWHIAPVIQEDFVLDGTGTKTLFVPTMKLVDIISVVVDGVVVDPASLEWSEAGFIRAPGIWTDKLRSVRLTIEHGHESAPDVAEKVIAIAARASASPTGVVRENAGAFGVSYSTTAPGVAGGVVLMEHERKQLDRYRLPGRL